MSWGATSQGPSPLLYVCVWEDVVTQGYLQEVQMGNEAK